jgi:carbon-monoxide dehydrogenase medium subunit
MKAAAFDYVRAETLNQALHILSERGEAARILAGGQSLAPALNLRLATPDLLVDINGLTKLRFITATDDVLRLGALTRHVDLARSEEIAGRCPLLSRAAAHIAHPAIRHRGTLGGSLAQADPAAELPACALALDAVIVASSSSGERRIAARDFFLGVYQTALRPDEVLTSVEISGLGVDRIYGFAKLARRQGDFAIIGLALAARRSDRGFVDLRLAFFGVADRPMLAVRAAAALEGKPDPTRSLHEARAALRADLNPVSDLHASAEMRLYLADVLLERVFAEVLEPAR